MVCLDDLSITRVGLFQYSCVASASSAVCGLPPGVERLEGATSWWVSGTASVDEHIAPILAKPN